MDFNTVFFFCHIWIIFLVHLKRYITCEGGKQMYSEFKNSLDWKVRTLKILCSQYSYNIFSSKVIITRFGDIQLWSGTKRGYNWANSHESHKNLNKTSHLRKLFLTPRRYFSLLFKYHIFLPSSGAYSNLTYDYISL